MGLDAWEFPQINEFIDRGGTIVTPSAWSREQILRNNARAANSTFIVPHGYAADYFYPATDQEKDEHRKAFGLLSEDIVLLNVSSLSWNKGIDILLRAFSELLETHPRLLLILKDSSHLYGTSAESVVLAAYKTKLISDRAALRVRFLTGEVSVETMRNLYQASDLYVSLYRAEGFNVPVAEALACKLAVVATAGGSTDDFIFAPLASRVDAEAKAFQAADGSIKYYLEPQYESALETIHHKISALFCNTLDPKTKLIPEELFNDWKRVYSYSTITRQLGKLLGMETSRV